jgi:hypothetical protein
VRNVRLLFCPRIGLAGAVIFRSAGVSPAVFGLWPKTSLRNAADETSAAATGTVALPKQGRMFVARNFVVLFIKKLFAEMLWLRRSSPLAA